VVGGLRLICDLPEHPILKEVSEGNFPEGQSGVQWSGVLICVLFSDTQIKKRTRNNCKWFLITKKGGIGETKLRTEIRDIILIRKFRRVFALN